MPWLSRSYIHYVSMTIAGSVGHLRSPPSPTNKETIAMVHAMGLFICGRWWRPEMSNGTCLQGNGQDQKLLKQCRAC